MRCQQRSEAGFTLVECLVAMVVVLVITGALLALVNPNTNASFAQPEAMDMNQRARVAAEVLYRDLFQAGAGLDAGPGVGALLEFFAPIVPRRLGLQAPDGFTTGRSDALTIVLVPTSSAQTTVLTSMPAGASQIDVENAPGCPVGASACGLSAGMTAVVFDRAGTFDLFAVTGVLASVADVQHHGSGSSGYQAGDLVAQAETHTYYHDRAARQLRHYDGYLTDTPVADNVVGVEFEYFGDPQPPIAPRPPAGVANCLYDVAGDPIGGLATLTPEGGSLAPLPLAMLHDGPWCGAGANRYDADLLRIRQVRVTLRVQATQAGFRASGQDFAVAGFSRSAERYLPDLTVRFDVSPRNLNLAR